MAEVRLGSRTLQPGRQLLAGTTRVPLGRRALEILSLLAEAKGGIVTKDELFAAVWQGVVVEENALQVHVAALRRALGPEASRLQTIRGIGYQLEIDCTAGIGGPLEHGAHDRIPLVVEPLAAGGSDTQTEAALARGVTDELIVRLRRIPELRVGCAGPRDSPPAEAFRHAHVVNGTVQSSGDRLRITVRLVRPDGEVAWSQTFDRRLVDLLDLQEEVAYAICDELSVPLAVGSNATEHGGTDNPEAYAAYVEANAHWMDFDQSVPLRYLRRAVELDPRFIKALGQLAVNYGLRLSMLASPAEADGLLAEMDACSGQALAANSGSATGHAARCFYHIARLDLPAARRHATLAAELDSGKDAVLRISLATFALWFGRPEQASAFLRANEEIDPIYRLEPFYVLDLLMRGRYQEAIDHFERVERDTPFYVEPFVFHVFFAYLMTDRESEALAFSDRRNPKFADDLRAFRANLALPTTSPAELKSWTAERHGHNQFGIAGTALFAALDGHDTLAVELMRLALESPGGNGLLYLWHPVMARARETVAFAQLATDLGYADLARAGDRADVFRPVGLGDGVGFGGRR